MSLGAVLSLVVAGMPQAPGQTNPADNPDIVVIGKRIAESDAALKACIARHCSPREDIAASLAHIENLFMRGDIRNARRIAAAAVSRNHRYASQLPVEVAGLTRAKANLTNYDGRPVTARINTIDALDALEAGLSSDDPRVLRQRLDVADAFGRVGRLFDAVSLYNKVIDQARTAQLPDVEGDAMFRIAVLRAAVGSVIPSARREADRAMARLARTTDPAMAPYRDGIVLLKAKLAPQDKQAALAAAALSRLDMAPTATPRLLYAPAVDLSSVASAQRGRTVSGPQSISGGPLTTPWVDMSFRIGTDGHVADLRVVRKSPNFEAQWLAPITEALIGRRYAPLVVSAGTSGVSRIERYIMIGDVGGELISRIQVRGAPRRVEIIDLTGP